jgi:hypothetical protein
LREIPWSLPEKPSGNGLYIAREAKGFQALSLKQKLTEAKMIWLAMHVQASLHGQRLCSVKPVSLMYILIMGSIGF